MTKRAMLYSNEVEDIVQEHLKGKPEWIRDMVTVEHEGPHDHDRKIVYYYNQAQNTVIVPGALLAQGARGEFRNFYVEATYLAALTAILKDLKSKKMFHEGNAEPAICGQMLGAGTSEWHYVAFHQQGSRINIFDSKESSPKRFLSSSVPLNVFQKIIDIFQKIGALLWAPFQAIGLALGIGKRIHSTFAGKPVTFHRLGTQPLFDCVSCGLHSAGAIIKMSELVDQGRCSNQQIAEGIIEATTNGGSTALDVRAEKIFEEIKGRQIQQPQPASVSIALGRLGKLPTKLDAKSEPRLIDELESKIELRDEGARYLVKDSGTSLSPEIDSPTREVNCPGRPVLV